MTRPKRTEDDGNISFNDPIEYSLLKNEELTEGQKAGRALREGEAKFRGIFNASIDAILIFSTDGIIAAANPAACAMYGYKDGEMIGLSDADIVHPDCHFLFEEFKKQLQSTGKFHAESVDLRKDGTPFNIEVRGTLFQYLNEPHLLAIVRDITERKKEGEALSEAKNIINRSPAVAFLWKNEKGWPVEFVSENVEKLFGYSAQEFMERKITFDEMIYNNDLERVMGEVASYSKRKGLQSFAHEPYRIITKNGDIKWIEDNTYIRRDPQGIITHYEGIVFDITERKHAEEALKESEEKFRVLFDSSPEGIAIMDLNGTILDYNEAQKNIGLIPKEEAIGKPFAELGVLSADDLERFIPLFQEMIQGKKVEPVEVRLKGEDKECWLEIHPGFVKNKGEITGIQILTLDITKRKRAEEALKRSEKDYRDLFNNATDAIYIQDKESHFLDVNQGAVDMYGYPKEFFIGKTPEFLSAPGKNDLKKIDGFVEDAFNGKPKQYDFWGIRKNGEVFPKIVRSHKGIYLGKEVVVTFAIDITERKEAEEELREHFKRLERFNKLTVGRELRMTEMKDEVNSLLEEMGREPRYPSARYRKKEGDQ